MGYTKYQADIAFGKVPTRKYINVMGFNAAVALTNENIWDAGGLYTYLSVNTELFLTSSNPGDAQFVEIQGLTEDVITGDWEERIAIIALTGQTPVSTGEWIRIRSIRNFSGLVPTTTATPFIGDVFLADGTAAWAAGVPTVLSSKKSQINTTTEHSRNGFYTVPSGFKGNIISFETYSSTLNAVTFKMRVRLFGGVFWEVQTLNTLISHTEIEFFAIEGFPPKTDCEIIAIAATGTQTVSIFSSWELETLPAATE